MGWQEQELDISLERQKYPLETRHEQQGRALGQPRFQQQGHALG